MIKELGLMLNDYYSIELPSNILEELLDSDNWLHREVGDGCAADTMVREVALEHFCRYYKIPTWPTHGDTAKYKAAFCSALKAKVIELGGKFHIQGV